MTPPLPFTLDGEPLHGRAGDTLAAALLRNGVTTFTRSIKYHRPRGPFCLSGSCGQCLVRVDGVPSLPACQVELTAGMACERQNGPLGLVEQDLFRAVDFLYPGGLDHHHLMVQSRLLGRVALEVARRLAGLGTLPDEPRPSAPAAAREVPLVIIGAGSSGLRAVRAAVRAGAAPLLLEKDASVGGASRLWADDRAEGSPVAAVDGAGAVRASGEDGTDGNHCDANQLPAGAELLLGAEVVGLYADAQGDHRALLAVRQGDRLLALRARRVILCCGGAPQPLPFAGNDRPGVYAARGLLELHRRSQVRVGEGEPLALLGAGEELARCARALVARGYALAALVALDGAPVPGPLPAGVELLRGEPLRARGRPVAEVQVRLAGAGKDEGARRKIRCGAVALALPPAPLYDLAASAGARAELSLAQGGFPLVIDADGRTSLPWLFAAGTVAGGAGDPARAGEIAAREAVATE